MGCGENCPKRGSLHLSPGQGVVGVLPPLGDLVIRTADPASRWGTARIWIYDEFFLRTVAEKNLKIQGGSRGRNVGVGEGPDGAGRESFRTHPAPAAKPKNQEWCGIGS